jgi:cysteinyl-tRNA synthetase
VPFVKYWLHNGLLRPSEEQEKMTRHLGNFISCEEALRRYNPDAIRLFILSSHYRSPVTWSEKGILAADRGLERLRTALKPASGEVETGGQELLATTETVRKEFIEAMDDDFNTARAIGHLFDLGRAINQARDSGVAPSALDSSQQVLRELTGVLGLTLQEREVAMDAEPFLQLAGTVAEALEDPEMSKSLKGHLTMIGLATDRTTHAEKLIDRLLLVRNDLRAAREYQQADKIRTGLADLGIVVEDGPEGSTWRVVSSP